MTFHDSKCATVMNVLTCSKLSQEILQFYFSTNYILHQLWHIFLSVNCLTSFSGVQFLLLIKYLLH